MPNQAAQDRAAALAAAEAARRAAEEAARKAAEEAQRRAAEARRLAAEAQRKADEARKAAEAAEAQAAKTKAKADADEAARLSKEAKAAELDALKQDAKANLAEKEKTLADAKLDDVRQRRSPGDPSEATRAATNEVNAARQTVALYEPVSVPGQPPVQAPPSAGTQTLLDKAHAAAKPVFDAQAQGREPTQQQKDALNTAVNEWLDAAQQDMRNAALKAQAEGRDPNAAIRSEADKIKQAVDRGGEFDPAALGAHVDQRRDAVLAESPGARQLRSEQYNVNQTGKQQVADATQAAKDADAKADEAERYAASFGAGPAGNDTVATARQQADAEAARLRGLANQAEAKLDGLVKAYGRSDPNDPTNPKTNVLGWVNADYNAKVADLEVGQLADQYQQALAGGDAKKIADAGLALDDARDAQRLLHALRDDAKAQLELRDSETEYTDAEAAWRAESGSRPAPYTVTERRGNETETKTVKPDGYDPAFWATPGSEEGKHVERQGDKYYYVTDDGKQELDPITARWWAAHDKREAARTDVTNAGKVLEGVKEDLLGGADGSGPKLDASRYLGDADGINKRLADANAAVDAAYRGLSTQRPPGFIGPVVASTTTPEELGRALQQQRSAQADADALKAMQALRNAERDQASGKPVDAKQIDTLRTEARDAQRKAEDLRPKLAPEQEKEMREKLLPDARKQLRTQDETVTRLTAPGSQATEDERRLALNQRDALQLKVRDYETQLELIDADRDALAARHQYDRTGFAKPQLSMFTEKRSGSRYGDGVTMDIYPDGYDPTWNIVPDANGKVSAQGLPRGISPDDVKVERVCDTWYVTFKKDSEVLGRQSDLTTNYVVQEGRYKMHPATARLWETAGGSDGRLARAGAARKQVEDDLRAAAADGPPPENTQPLIGPDGKPVPTLRLGEDLTQRKQTVDQRVLDLGELRKQAQRNYDNGTGDRTQLKNALDDAIAEETIARNEQAAVQAALEWQEANRARQLYEANERAGRPQTMCYAKPPREHAEELRNKAITARATWLDTRNQHHTQSAERDLGLKQAAHDRWKREHPGLAETSSDTWAALQQARGKVDDAKRYQVASNETAAAREQQFLSDNLRPDQYDDRRALYRLFMQNPQVMAQSVINQHYVQYGSEPMQMAGRTHLENEVALALGWQPSRPLDPGTPTHNAELRRTQPLFTNLSHEQKEVLRKTVDQIIETGGDKARVTVLPVVYGLDSDQGGIVKTALFEVEQQGKPGQVKYVDEQGWEYDDLDDYRANNHLPVEGVNLVMPEDGNFTLDDQGNVKLFVGDARTETGWETFRRETKLDLIVGGVGLVAGVVLTVGSLGTLSAPGVMLAAGSLTLMAAGYGIATSAESLHKQYSHGQDINPLTSTQARLDWLNLGLSALSVPVVGSSSRVALLGVRANRALKAADDAARVGDEAGKARHLAEAKQLLDRSASAAGTAETMARSLGRPLAVGSVYAFEEGGRYLLENWDHMTPAERNQQLGMLGLNAAGFASPVFARGYVRTHQTIKTAWNARQPGAPGEGVPAGGRTTGTVDPQTGLPTSIAARDGGAPPRVVPLSHTDPQSPTRTGAPRSTAPADAAQPPRVTAGEPAASPRQSVVAEPVPDVLAPFRVAPAADIWSGELVTTTRTGGRPGSTAGGSPAGSGSHTAAPASSAPSNPTTPARRRFRGWALREIARDPAHLLRFLIEPKPSGKGMRFLVPPTREHHNLIGGDYVESGHLTSNWSLGSGATAAPEHLALQDAYSNQLDNVSIEQRHIGGFAERKAIDIGGVPVELRTARMWESEGKLPAGTVAGAKPHTGWVVPEARSGAPRTAASAPRAPAATPTTLRAGPAATGPTSTARRPRVVPGGSPDGVPPTAAGRNVGTDEPSAASTSWSVPADRVGDTAVADLLLTLYRAGGQLEGASYYLYPKAYDDVTGLLPNVARQGLRPAFDAASPQRRAAVYAQAERQGSFGHVRPHRYASLDEARAAAQPEGMNTARDEIAIVLDSAIAPDGSVPPSAVLATVGLDVPSSGGPARVASITPTGQPLRVAYPQGYDPALPLIRTENGQRIDLLNTAPGRSEMGVNVFRRRVADLDLFAPGERPRRPDGSPTREEVPLPEGVFAVDGHGLEGRVEGPDGQPLAPADLARLISEHDGYHGQPVFLLSCLSGDGAVPFAQQLATLLGTDVYAATQSVRSRGHSPGPDAPNYVHGLSLLDAGSSYNGGVMEAKPLHSLPIVEIRSGGRVVYDDIPVLGPPVYARFRPGLSIEPAGTRAPGGDTSVSAGRRAPVVVGDEAPTVPAAPQRTTRGDEGETVNVRSGGGVVPPPEGPPAPPAGADPAGTPRGGRWRAAWERVAGGPTNALLGVASLQSASLANKLAGWDIPLGFTAISRGAPFDHVTGGPGQAFVSQVRGVGTRAAYFRGKRGLENALELARTGQPDAAVQQLRHMAQHRRRYGLSPDEVNKKLEPAIQELYRFGEASAVYRQQADAASLPGPLQRRYGIRLQSEAELKTGAPLPMGTLRDGHLVQAVLQDAGVPRGPGVRRTTDRALAQAVDAHRTRLAHERWHDLPDAVRQHLRDAAADPERVAALEPHRAVIDAAFTGQRLHWDAGLPRQVQDMIQLADPLPARLPRRVKDAEAALRRLSPELQQRAVAAREAELAYTSARDAVRTSGNLIDTKGVQGALGSTMHMDSRIGRLFKYGALGFATNTGIAATYKFIVGASVAGPKDVLKTIGLSGEVVGNVPNIAIQWSYLKGLMTRTRFSDTSDTAKVTQEQVVRYLEQRRDRMQGLDKNWWGGLERAIPAGVRDKARLSIEADAQARVRAEAEGTTPPLENRTFSKHVLLRRQQAQDRVTALNTALESKDAATMRKAAKEESVLAAKSMNTAGDFMALASMYRYGAMATLGAVTGHPYLAAITAYHGLVSNGGWLRAQQGTGTIYGLRMAPRALDDGNGFLGVGRRLGRGYNQLLDAVPTRYGESAAKGLNWSLDRLPLANRLPRTDNLFSALKLDPTVEGAANRRRIRMLLTGTTVPLLNLYVALNSGDEKEPKPPAGPGGGPTPTPSGSVPTPTPSATPTPTVPPSTEPEPEPPRTDGPDDEPVRPPPKDEYWTVDGAIESRSSFTRIAEAKARRDDIGYNQALDQLFNLNPQYKRSQMDGYVHPTRLDDPDALNNGTRLNIGPPP
ncbi:hypothetical protein AAW51_5381 [Caldimonas brevitalea]|uniref:DUF4781 domain-containing protein n=1 Tax=Caldimonas brevitalea TaxID=413882 RepID=A0A0G3BRN0_9BURK|nr:hypothetical protein AAW51_5381 [Caldimonas brevitalea]